MQREGYSNSSHYYCYRTYARVNAGGRGGYTRIAARGTDGTQQVFIVPTSLLQGHSSSTGTPLTPEDVLLGATGRRYNPNMPPSYDQAVTGQDKSVKVEEGGTQVAPTAPPPTTDDYPPPPEYSTTDTTQLLP